MTTASARDRLAGFSARDVEDTRRLAAAERRAVDFARASGRPALLVHNSSPGTLDLGIVRLFCDHGRDFVSALGHGEIVIPFRRVDEVRFEVERLRRRMIDGDSWIEGASILLRGFAANGERIRC